MPRVGWIKPNVDHRLSDHLAFAVLMKVFPPDLVDEVVAEFDRQQLRTRILTSRVVVYYVLGLALSSNSSYEEVIRLLIAAQSWSSGWTEPLPEPTKAALYKARVRLGPEPLQRLFERVASQRTTPTNSTGYRGLRVVGVDGVSLTVPPAEANEAEFGGPATIAAHGVASPNFPTVRVLGVTERGTGAVVGATIGNRFTDDGQLFGNLLPLFSTGDLIIAGPQLYSEALWQAAAATGAEVLWELPERVSLTAGPRIIEHASRSESSGVTTYRHFATTLRDPHIDPSTELMSLFGEPRTMAAAFDDFRAHHNSPGIVLRSKSPEGVRQEIYGYLCTHYAIRWIMNAPGPPRDLGYK